MLLFGINFIYIWALVCNWSYLRVIWIWQKIDSDLNKNRMQMQGVTYTRSLRLRVLPIPFQEHLHKITRRTEGEKKRIKKAAAFNIKL